jgi:hypothetical protein
MSVLVIAGFSNSGKSTSLRYLNPSETFIINVNNKQLAIPGFRKNYSKLHKEFILDEKGNQVMNKTTKKPDFKWIGNYYQSDNYGKLHTVLNIVDGSPFLSHIKYLVVDDINYLMGQDTMSMATTASRDKYSTFAYNYNNMLHRLMSMRDDLQVIIISHLQKDEDTGAIRLISNSKFLDKQLVLDGMFNYIIYCEKLVDEIEGTVKYVYRTRTLGNDTCRSTSGCFKDLYIEPNIKKCIDRINAFENGDEEPEYPEGNKVGTTEESKKSEKTEENKKEIIDDNDI